jgi:hypothetical protein
VGNPTVGSVGKAARAFLNDQDGTKYTNQRLLPYTQAAIDELEDELLLISSEIFEETSAVLDIPANTLELKYSGSVPTLPSDLVEPVSLEEKVDGAVSSTFVLMTKKRDLSVTPQVQTLNEWTWQEQSIKFIGATVPVDLRITYMKGFPALIDPCVDTQEIPYNEAAPFLQYKVAALAAEFIMGNHDRAIALHESAIQALNRTLGIRTRSQQDLPVRHREWRRASRR